jgi:molecular chaperone GrpE
VSTQEFLLASLNKQLYDCLQDAGSEGQNGDSPEAATTSVMSMADSLIERAQEAANSGIVDDAFKEVFVSELQAELAVLQQRAASAEASASAFEETLKATKDKFVRLSADFENFRKRTATERDSLRDSVKGDTMTALLPLIDNFELAKSQLKLETEGEKKVDAAYQGLYKQMVELFRSLGLEAVPGAGEPFDPEVHEAIMREPSDEVPDGTVLEEFRKGFRLGDRLLRPAMVKVSYNDAPAPAAESSDEETTASE